MYFARALPDATTTLGQFYLFETIVSFAVILASGAFPAAATKRISEGEDQAEYAGAVVLTSTTLATATTVLLLLLSPLIVSQFQQGTVVLLFIIGLVWAMQVEAVATAILQGLSKVGRTGGIGMLENASRAVAQGVLVFFGLGLLGLAGGAFAGTALAALVAVAILNADIGLPNREHIIDLFEYARYAFISGLTTKFYNNVDIIIITTFLGASATGIYGIGFRFSLLLTIFTGAVSRSSLPEISRHATAGDTERVEEILADAFIYATLFAVPAFAGMLVIAKPLIVTFYTGEFAGAATVALVAVAIQIPDGLRSVFSSTLNAVDRPDVPMRGGIILITANLLLDLALVPTIGVLGAVVASFIGITLSTVYLGWQLLTELNLTIGVLPFQPLLQEAVAAAVMAGIVFLARQKLSMGVIPKLLVLITVGVLVYFGVVLLISPSIRRRLSGIADDVVPVRG
jgi:O-antigen/teichoic acid export membrane protein